MLDPEADQGSEGGAPDGAGGSDSEECMLSSVHIECSSALRSTISEFHFPIPHASRLMEPCETLLSPEALAQIQRSLAGHNEAQPADPSRERSSHAPETESTSTDPETRVTQSEARGNDSEAQGRESDSPEMQQSGGEGSGADVGARGGESVSIVDADGDLVLRRKKRHRRRRGASSPQDALLREPTFGPLGCDSGGAAREDPCREAGQPLREAGDGSRSARMGRVAIQHRMKTPLPHVGMQVWEGALLLADFLLANPWMLRGSTVVELGSGTGVLGVIAAMVGAEHVFLTDVGNEVLRTCALNVSLNSPRIRAESPAQRDCKGITPAAQSTLLPRTAACSSAQGSAPVLVRELDWARGWPPRAQEPGQEDPFSWTKAEVQLAQSATLLLAADVIYDDDLTVALFRTLLQLCLKPPQKLLLLALEKRFNFTLEDGAAVAHGYACFRSHVQEVPHAQCLLQRDSSAESPGMPWRGWMVPGWRIPRSISGSAECAHMELWMLVLQGT